MSSKNIMRTNDEWSDILYVFSLSLSLSLSNTVICMYNCLRLASIRTTRFKNLCIWYFKIMFDYVSSKERCSKAYHNSAADCNWLFLSQKCLFCNFLPSHEYGEKRKFLVKLLFFVHEIWINMYSYLKSTQWFDLDAQNLWQALIIYSLFAKFNWVVDPFRKCHMHR